MGVMSKVGWSAIYEDFQQRFPRLRQCVSRFEPFNYLQIKIRNDDDSIILIYDYRVKTCEIVKYA